MKWINLADRYPSGKPEFIIRRVGSMNYQIIETIVQSSLGNFAFREHSHYYEIPKDKEAEYEWLDESDPREEYAQLKKHIEELQIKYDGLVEAIEEEEKSQTIITYQESQWLEYKKGNQSFRQYLENVYPNEEIVDKPYSADFVATNEKLKRMWHLDSTYCDGEMRDEYNKGLFLMKEYYYHQYLYWKNRQSR